VSEYVSSNAVEAGPATESASTSRAVSGVPRTSAFPALILIRHGETVWSKSGQHTGRTDIGLTQVGEVQAEQAGTLIRALLATYEPSLIISSPRQRALYTAELAGFEPDEITEDAAEWDYGDYEGLTSAQIRQQNPAWTIWSSPVPGGEDAAAVIVRLDRLLERVERHRAAGPVLIFSHGHASRCIAARWLGRPVADGQQYSLGTGAVSSLGYEHEQPVILRWNLDKSVVWTTP
jgi:broad specificity phosphatase PhoE